MRIKTHPSEILRKDFMQQLSISVNELSIFLRIPLSSLADIVNGKCDITAATALRFAKFFDTTPEFWLNLQMEYDLSKALAENQAEIESIPTFESLEDADLARIAKERENEPTVAVKLDEI